MQEESQHLLLQWRLFSFAQGRPHSLSLSLDMNIHARAHTLQARVDVYAEGESAGARAGPKLLQLIIFTPGSVCAYVYIGREKVATSRTVLVNALESLIL